MNILSIRERLHKHIITTEMSQDTQFNLWVIGTDQQILLFNRNKRSPNTLAFFRTHRNILQVWRRARQASCRRNRLIERCMYTIVLINQFKQSINIGAFQFCKLAIIQNATNDRMVVAQSLQYFRTCRVACFRLFDNRQFQNFKQNMSQLFWRVWIDRFSSHDFNILFNRLNAFIKLFLQFFKILCIHANTNNLHLCQNPRQWQFNIQVQIQAAAFSHFSAHLWIKLLNQFQFCKVLFWFTFRNCHSQARLSHSYQIVIPAFRLK